MAWDIVSKKFHNSQFQNLRWHLLLSYLTVMAATLAIFSAGVYIFFSRSLYHQLDEKLQTLAQAAAPSLWRVQTRGSEYLELVEANTVPWSDLFNRDQQSLQWFDANGTLLATKGQLSLVSPPDSDSPAAQDKKISVRIRSFTIPVYQDSSNPGEPSLEGYIRASQSTEVIQTAQNQLLWGLGMGGVFTLGLVGIGGLWLSQKALHPIEKSFQQLKQFTADASHELRSPLTAIKTSVSVMQSYPERIHPKDVKKLAAIANATDQMVHLLENLLFLARSDANLPEQDWDIVNLHEVLQDLLILLEPSAQMKKIALKLEWQGFIHVWGDANQLTRLFSNLLENALQYTPIGGKVILAVEENGRYCMVSIQDTGIGIAPSQIPLVFNRFWRADKARSRREGGMGLGLAIASAIAHRHSGKITLRSQLGVGTCFQVQLPILLTKSKKR